MTATYISAADTAKLLRTALKAAFPLVTFSVRTKTYAGGASIKITYWDGPPIKSVEEVANAYEGSHFDGMQDLKTARYHDGPNGERIHYSADYVNVERKYSVGALECIAGLVAAKWGIETPSITTDEYIGAYTAPDSAYVYVEHACAYVQELMYREARVSPLAPYNPK